MFYVCDFTHILCAMTADVISLSVREKVVSSFVTIYKSVPVLK